MFTDFLYALREQRVPVGLGEWLALHEALGKGLIEGLDDLNLQILRSGQIALSSYKAKN